MNAAGLVLLRLILHGVLRKVGIAEHSTCVVMGLKEVRFDLP